MSYAEHAHMPFYFYILQNLFLFLCAAFCWNPLLLLVLICHKRDKNRRRTSKARLTPISLRNQDSLHNQDSIVHIARLFADTKISIQESGFRSFRISWWRLSDTCRQKAYPLQKCCGCKTIWVRVDERRIHNKNVPDTKILGYLWTKG